MMFQVRGREETHRNICLSDFTVILNYPTIQWPHFLFLCGFKNSLKVQVLCMLNHGRTHFVDYFMIMIVVFWM
jgi:hypothetical protein